MIFKCTYTCTYYGHSGAFTKGGSQPVCDHDKSCGIERISKTKFRKQYPCYRSESKGSDWKYHWVHRIVPANKIAPEWCPLKQGIK